MEKSFILQKAETNDIKFSNPVLSMTAALSGLGAFGGIICLCMVLMSALSGGNVSSKFFCAATVITIICGMIFVAVSFTFQKQKKMYLKKRKELSKNAVRVQGKVVGVTKYVRHVKYMKETFDEVLWCYKIKYKDGDKYKTVQSDKYLNDISKVLKSDKVDVLILEDKTLVFKNYQLRKDETEPYVKFETEEIEQEAEL